MSKRKPPLHVKEPLYEIEVQHMLRVFDEIQLDLMDLDGHQVLHSELFDEIKRFVADLKEGDFIHRSQGKIVRVLLPRRAIDTE